MRRVSECGMLKDMAPLRWGPSVSRPEMDIKTVPKKGITLSSILVLSHSVSVRYLASVLIKYKTHGLSHRHTPAPRLGRRLTMSTIIAEPPAYPLAPESASASSSSQDLLDRSSSSTPPPAYTERASRKFRITAAPGAGMLNAAILDASGCAHYTTTSDAKLKKTTVRRAAVPASYPGSGPDAGGDLARVGWDRSSPRVRFLVDVDGTELPKKSKKHKIKCKQWLPRARADTQYVFFFLFLSHFVWADTTRCERSRVLTLHGTRYTITERKGANGYVRSPSPFFRTDLTRLQLLCSKDDADASPLLPLARWRTMLDAQSQQLEVFDDACATPGLLDALVLALVVLQSGQPLGDVPDCLNVASPMFSGSADLACYVCFIE